jgi:hypothetical protein
MLAYSPFIPSLLAILPPVWEHMVSESHSLPLFLIKYSNYFKIATQTRSFKRSTSANHSENSSLYSKTNPLSIHLKHRSHYQHSQSPPIHPQTQTPHKPSNQINPLILLLPHQLQNLPVLVLDPLLVQKPPYLRRRNRRIRGDIRDLFRVMMVQQQQKRKETRMDRTLLQRYRIILQVSSLLSAVYSFISLDIIKKRVSSHILF